MKQPFVKFVVALALTALLAFLSAIFLPWWSIAIAAFLVSLLVVQTPSLSFLAGFAALFLMWGIMAWYISDANRHLLAGRISALIFKTQAPTLLILITALTGALVAGLAALTGSYLYRLIRRDQKQYDKNKPVPSV